jgi:uncharacterized protein (TIGR00369 family)
MNDAPHASGVVPRTTSGLDYLQKIIRGEIPGVPIGSTLGFRLTEAEKGRVVLLGKPDLGSYNLLNSVHGGWGAAILDTALALAVLTMLEADQAFTTVDIRVNYLRPLTVETGEVRAEGRVLQVGRKLGYSEARLTDPAGKLLAHGTGSCLILPRTA